jgi:hypothetical protein
MEIFGKILILFGIIFIGIGTILLFLEKLPFLGKLPGDILIQKKNLTFYFPLTTSIIISLFLSFLFWIFSRH